MEFLGFKFAEVILVLIVILQTSSEEDWPVFRHDLEHTGETSDVIEKALEDY